MKRIVFVLFFILTIGYAEAKKIKGVIVYATGAVEVTFKVPVGLLASEPSLERMQYKVIYYDAEGKRQVLRPGTAKEIRFTYKDKEIRMLSRSTGGIDFPGIITAQPDIFLKLVVDGPVKLFNFYFTRSSGVGISPSTGMMSPTYDHTVERYLLQKGNGPLKRPKALSFRKDMKQYFSDCPELGERIENKDFKKNEMLSIVEFYNTQCK